MLCLNQADLHPVRFLVRLCPWLGTADEQSFWVELLVGHCRYELSLTKSICWLLQALLSFSVPFRFSGGWAPQIPLQSPCDKLKVGVPTKYPTMTGQFIVPSGFSFHIGGTGGLGNTSLYNTVLAWRGGIMWSMCSFLSSNVVCLGLCGIGENFRLTLAF